MEHIEVETEDMIGHRIWLAASIAMLVVMLAAAEVIGHYGPRPQVSLEALAKAEGLF